MSMKPDEEHKHDQFLQLYVETESSLRGFVRSLVPSLEEQKENPRSRSAKLRTIEKI